MPPPVYLDASALRMTPAELAVMRGYCKRAVPRLAWSPEERAKFGDLDRDLETMTTDEIFVVLSRAFSTWTAKRLRQDGPVPEILVRNGLYNAYVSEELVAYTKYLNKRMDLHLRALAAAAVAAQPQPPPPDAAQPASTDTSSDTAAHEPVGTPLGTPVKKRKAESPLAAATPLKMA
jgi:hypothetical protein